jgi:tetratricopeptide (TPR) repeat protein
MPSTAQRPSAGALPDWQTCNLADGVLTEPIPGTGRMALWLPDGRDDGAQLWQRVAPSDHTGFEAGPGIRAAAANSIRARQRTTGLIGKLFRRAEGRSWALPNGHNAEQIGERRTDLLLVWTEDESTLDETWFKSRWPESDGALKVGKALYLISGVKATATVPTAAQASMAPEAGYTVRPAAPAPRATPVEECPRNVAERLLKAARDTGDRARVAAALADLGAVHVHEGSAELAVKVLGEALAIAHEIGDRLREADVLSSLGLVTLSAGHPIRALEIFNRQLAIARETGDRFSGKTALERMGLAYVTLNEPGEAVIAFGQALDLARAVGHRQNEADLLWYLAITHAELGHRDQALVHAQDAVELMKQLGNPQASVFAEHLRKFQAGETGAALAAAPSPATAGSAAYLGGVVEAGLWAAPASSAAPATGPGLLRMALSAAKSMAKFVGSGFKTAPPLTVQLRLQTCAACEHHTGMRCRLCGCFTNAKARLAHEHCPIGKWPS